MREDRIVGNSAWSPTGRKERAERSSAQPLGSQLAVTLVSILDAPRYASMSTSFSAGTRL